MQTEVWTIGRLLTWTTDYLRKKGSESARLDAEVLLAHAKNCQRIQLYTAFNDEPDEGVKATFREMVRKRAEGTPVAYLVGHKEFYSLDFTINSNCLIPRPETEHLVVAAIDLAKTLKQFTPNLTIADVCTGSGCIAVAVAKHVSNAKLYASDINSEVLAIAQSNVTRHQLADRVTCLQSDLLEAFPTSIGLFDMILSNPPYVSQSEYDQLSKGVREYEPRSALLAGPTGAEISERLILQSSTHLREGGFLLLESSPMLAPKIEEFIANQTDWLGLPTVKDLQGHRRIIVAMKR